MRGMKTSTREATRRHGASCWVLRLLASTLYLGYWHPSKQLRVNLFEGKLKDPLHTQKFLETCSQSREDQNLSSGEIKAEFQGIQRKLSEFMALNRSPLGGMMTGGGRGWGLKDVAIDRYGWGPESTKALAIGFLWYLPLLRYSHIHNVCGSSNPITRSNLLHQRLVVMDNSSFPCTNLTS